MADGEIAKNRKRKTVGVNERGYRVGESHHRAKLSDRQVDEVLELREKRRANGTHVWSLGALARRYGVSKSTIRDIVNGRHRVQYPVAWRTVAVALREAAAAALGAPLTANGRADNGEPPADNPPHER